MLGPWVQVTKLAISMEASPMPSVRSPSGEAERSDWKTVVLARSMDASASASNCPPTSSLLSRQGERREGYHGVVRRLFELGLETEGVDGGAPRKAAPAPRLRRRLQRQRGRPAHPWPRSLGEEETRQGGGEGVPGVVQLGCGRASDCGVARTMSLRLGVDSVLVSNAACPHSESGGGREEGGGGDPSG